jgi:hypothetical protein
VDTQCDRVYDFIRTGGRRGYTASEIQAHFNYQITNFRARISDNRAKGRPIECRREEKANYFYVPEGQLELATPAFPFMTLTRSTIGLFCVRMALICLFCLLAVSVWGGELSDHDKRILDLVASERGLNQEETLLLYAIRSHEAGRPGLECGVEQPCAKYYADGFISLIVQADYAAWIIKERWNGSLWKFARAFHHGDLESDKHWRDNVETYMKRYRVKYGRGK